jgi:hypothetical protein
MRFIGNIICLVSFFLAFFEPRSYAAPGGRRSLTVLTTQAEAIVIGAVQTTETSATITRTINVERVLKGVATPGTSISIVWTYPIAHGEPGPPGSARVSNGHGVFFLVHDTTGSWSLLPASWGDARWEDTYIPTPSTIQPGLRAVASASLQSTASVLDLVVLEMVASAEAGAPPPYDLIATFRQSRSPVLAAAFVRFLSSQDPNLRSVGLRGAVSTGDPSIVASVRQNYATLSAVPGWLDLVEDIKFYYVNTNVAAVLNLGQVATDSTVGMDLRIATGVALARMHTQQTLPYLAALLDDPNATLKTAAVGGMSSFANNVPIGSHEPAAGAWQYRTDDTIAHSAFDEATIERQESYYIAFWKGWWQQNQQAFAR